MNCSTSRELGLGDDQSLALYSRGRSGGVPLTDYLGMSDVVLDCEITLTVPTAFL